MCEERRRQARLEPHDLIEDAMDQWNAQSDVYRSIKKDGGDARDQVDAISIVDANVRREKKNKLDEMLTHLQMKHAQLLHCLNQKEKLEAERLLVNENK